MTPAFPYRAHLALFVLALGTAGGPGPQWAQGQTQPEAAPAATEIAMLVQRLQADPRGPFLAIRWFCPDGSVRVPQERCEQPGGKQHGLAKPEVLQLQRTWHLFFDPVLTGTDAAAFWDAEHQQSRLKQYLLQQYLMGVDDGWILRQAQFYRGALQAEDEAEWSRQFVTWLLKDDDRLTQHYYLVREAVRGLPLQAGSDLQQRIRALATTLSDTYAPFLDLRVKIHGQPDSTDLVRVQAFRRQHADAAAPVVLDRLQALEDLLRQAYTAAPPERIRQTAQGLDPTTALAQQIRAALDEIEGRDARTFLSKSAALLWTLRLDVPALPPEQRLAALQASVALEEGIFRSATRWQPATLADLLEKTYVLAQAAAGAGFLEVWEWAYVQSVLRPPIAARLSSNQLRTRYQRARRVADWAVGTVYEAYRPVVETYEAFEPLARGFLDDRIRGSVLLPLGDAVGTLTGAYADLGGTRSDVLGHPEGRRARGLNPGVAVGPLRVVATGSAPSPLSPEAIYVFRQPPRDLTPVAGLASVVEGNVVSHVQLLARNLGIPNATVPPPLVDHLQRLDGDRVFFAVSPEGTVLLKPAREMTEAERALVRTRAERTDRFRVPTDRIALEIQRPVPLDSIRAADSGRICGPKAAKMGELKALFPERVADGLVVPFGAFRAHMEQPMSGTAGSYWDFLQATFQTDQRHGDGAAPAGSKDAIIVERLARLRTAIQAMPLRAGFVAELRQTFAVAFRQPLGRVPVFVRSDTNMEDLSDFTGAGLNLTVPNVSDEAALLNAIRDVWASAFSERSYQWRQRLLTNPGDLYPSILLLRSVNVDASGVLLTTGLTAGTPADVTVAFNRGVGGAVDGQAAETWVLRANGGDELLAPAREPTYRVLADASGLVQRPSPSDAPILSAQRRATLRSVAAEIRARLPAAQRTDPGGPYDVELGFVGDRLWLFQVRPFVENRRLRSVEYLKRLDAGARSDRRIPLNTRLQP